MSRFDRQVRAAQEQLDNASPPDSADLLDGEVDLTNPNDVHTFITDEMDDFHTVALPEALARYLISSRDEFAKATFCREMLDLAWRVERAIVEHNEGVIAAELELQHEMRYGSAA